MSMPRFRDVTPKGFYARSILILLLPLMLLLTAMTWFFFDSHIAGVSRKLSQSVAGEVAQVRSIILSTTDGRNLPERIDDIRQNLRMDVFVRPDQTLPEEDSSTIWSEERDQILDHELNISLAGTPYWFNTTDIPSKIDIRLAPENFEGVIRILVDRKRTFATMGHIFIVWVFLFTLLLITISLSFLRNQVRSVLKLAHAAEAWGRGEDIGEYHPSGATEVRQAAYAIIQMRERIVAHVEQRTAMLAGVSHDLRTPLTRLKLQLSLMPPSDDLKAARKDLDEMSAMLNEYLAFAKGQEGENYEEIDLSLLAHEISQTISGKAEVEFIPSSQDNILLRARPLALKRALSNLAQNAAGFGTKVRISIDEDKSFASISVEDNGPGIDEALYEDAFKPFFRLDSARNQNRSGVGLGLALARDVARSHGGDIFLSRSELGGLNATLRLPKSTRSV